MALKTAQQLVHESSDVIEKFSLKSLVNNELPNLKPCSSAFVSCSRNRFEDVEENDYYVDLNSIHLPVMNRENKHVGSAFLSLTRKMEGLPYCSENDIQFYLRALLMDAVSCLGIDAEIFGEMSLFSMRPDLVVVKLKQTGSIILIVEVKNPPLDMSNTGSSPRQSKNEEFASSPTLAGQVYDYLKAMVQSGHEMPFVVLSNNKEMYLARIPCKDAEYRALMDEAREYLLSDIVSFSKMLDTGFQGSKEIASPRKDFRAGCVANGTAGEKTGGSSDVTRSGDYQATAGVSPQSRKLRHRELVPKKCIMRSKVYKKEDEDFFKALVHVVACGVLSCRDINRTKHVLPVENEPAVKRGEMACVTEDDFSWKVLH